MPPSKPNRACKPLSRARADPPLGLLGLITALPPYPFIPIHTSYRFIPFTSLLVCCHWLTCQEAREDTCLKALREIIRSMALELELVQKQQHQLTKSLGD